MRESPRIRRLRTDRKALESLRADSTILEFEAHGSPPEDYLIRFLGKGFSRGPHPEPVVIQDVHEVHVRLGASYPRVMPGMQWNSGSHTNSLVPFYAKGHGAILYKNVATGDDPARGPYIDNTDVAKIIFTLLN